MKLIRYSAPAAEPVSLEEAGLLANSFSNGEPISGPAFIIGEEEYYEF